MALSTDVFIASPSSRRCVLAGAGGGRCLFLRARRGSHRQETNESGGNTTVHTISVRLWSPRRRGGRGGRNRPTRTVCNRFVGGDLPLRYSFSLLFCVVPAEKSKHVKHIADVPLLADRERGGLFSSFVQAYDETNKSFKKMENSGTPAYQYTYCEALEKL